MLSQKQEKQYIFPYHHIPYLDKDKVVNRYRILDWGFKYFCYLLHIKDKVESFKPKSVLDIGCGDGRLLGLLDKNINKAGVDFSEKAISFAKVFYPEIKFYKKDAREIDEEFDMVVVMEVLEHIPDENIDSLLKTLEKQTNKGGQCIISVPTKIQTLNRKHYRHYDLELFKKQLNDSDIKMKIENVEYIYKESFYLKFYKKLTFNRFWVFEINFINKFIWQYIWKKLRIADEKTGHCMIITLKNE